MKKYKLYKEKISRCLTVLNNSNITSEIVSTLTLAGYYCCLKDTSLLIGHFLYGLAVIWDTFLNRRLVMNYPFVDYYNEKLSDNNYLELKSKYKTYVKKLAEYISNWGFTDPLDIGLFFCAMLHGGGLSNTSNFAYFKVKNDKDFCYKETLGARIVSGYGVCRNMAALLTDLYREMGYDVNTLVVRTKIIEFSLHAVCFVKSEKGNFIIDPTWQTVAQIDDDLKKTSKIIFFNKNIEYNKQYYFLGYDDEFAIYNNIDDDFYKNKKTNRKLISDNVKKRYSHISGYYIDTLFCDNDEEHVPSFACQNEKIMQEISDIEQKLTRPKLKRK